MLFWVLEVEQWLSAGRSASSDAVYLCRGSFLGPTWAQLLILETGSGRAYMIRLGGK